MLKVNDIFPQPQDANRMVRETFNEKLLLSQSVGNYTMTEVNGAISHTPKDPLVPLPQTISDISADLLLGEFPTVLLDDKIQTLFDDWAFDIDLGVKMLEGATYVSALGTVLSVINNYDDMPKITLFPGNKVTWEESFGKITKATFILSKVLNKNGTTFTYKLQEWELENDQLVIRYSTVTTNVSNGKVTSVVETDEERPGLDFIPVAKWLNVGIMGKDYGRSDYSGKSQLFSEIDNRIDQNNSTIEENQDPWKAVPAGVLDENGQLNKSNFSAKMFEKTLGGQTDNTVDIMAWDANMPSAFQQIEMMVDMCFFTSRLSNSITGREKGGVSESGRALKWKSISTIAMKQRKEKYTGSFLRDIIHQWSKLVGKEVSKKEIKIVWQDGLPIDDQENTEVIVEQVNAGLMSKETAIMKLQEISTEEAQAEIDKINADEIQTAEIQAKGVEPLVI